MHEHQFHTIYINITQVLSSEYWSLFILCNIVINYASEIYRRGGGGLRQQRMKGGALLNRGPRSFPGRHSTRRVINWRPFLRQRRSGPMQHMVPPPHREELRLGRPPGHTKGGTHTPVRDWPPTLPLQRRADPMLTNNDPTMRRIRISSAECLMLEDDETFIVWYEL